MSITEKQTKFNLNNIFLRKEEEKKTKKTVKQTTTRTVYAIAPFKVGLTPHRDLAQTYQFLTE